MDVDDPDFLALLEAIDQAASPVKVVAIKATGTGPLRVSINGLGSVPAEAFAGQTFAVNDVGRALWSPPSPPICFKVT